MKSWFSSSTLLVTAIVVCLLALVAIRAPQGFQALAAKRREILELQEQNADLVRENERKRIRIQRLKTSQAEQELEIREKLKLMRPGETQFILPDKPKQQ